MSEDIHYKERVFIRELSELLNKHNKDSDTNTPDYVLAEMLNNHLQVYRKARVLSLKHEGKHYSAEFEQRLLKSKP